MKYVDSRQRALLCSAVAALLLVTFAVPAGTVPAQAQTIPSREPHAYDESVASDTRAARAALRRLLPEYRAQIVFRAVRPIGGAGGDYFRVFARGRQLVIAGTTPAVMLTGLNWYLKYVAGANITWTGRQLDLPDELPLPRHPIRKDASVPHRFALNDTNDGYTEPYAGWDYWEREIDLLAMHGVNEVLVYVGQAAVYYRTLREFGYSAKELREWIPNPAHQPWWLLQNMCCFANPLSDELLDRRIRLGQRIVKRLRELGITPVFPGYYGTVPPDFGERHPDAHVVPQGKWIGFQRPGWLDPTDEYFDRVAETFYRNQQELFGATTMYKMDLLHEGGRAGDVDVGAASAAVQDALQRAHPKAIWAILGWQDNPLPETIAAVDKSRMLILDGISDRYSGLNREQEWKGTPYAFGTIWNYGGNTAMGANMRVWNKRFWRWHGKSGSALSGIALMPEASDNNPVAFEFFTELAWRDGPVNFGEWFATWANFRYGGPDAHARRAWRALAETAYSMPANGSGEAHGGLFTARPSLTTTRARVYGPTEPRYDMTAFAQALPALLRVDPELRESSAYRYDLMAVTRQVLSNRSRMLLPHIKDAYDAGDIERFRVLSDRWLRLIEVMDAATATNAHTMLGPWLAKATTAASSRREADRLRYDALSLITVWGTEQAANSGLHDYANREWAGLLRDYYRARWKAYFDELEAALLEGREPAPIDWYAFGKRWARQTASQRGVYPTRPRGEIHRIASRVADQLRRRPVPISVAASVTGGAVTPQQPVTVSATLRNDNGFATATGVRARLEVPSGLAAEPLGARQWEELPPGGSTTVRWKVSVSDQDALRQLVARLRIDVDYRFPDGSGTSSDSVRVLTATGVDEPYHTVSSNNAVFGQRDGAFGIVGGGADMWGGTNEFGAIYREAGLSDGVTVATTVGTQEATGPWARAGLVARNDLGRGTKTTESRGYVNIAVTPANGCVLSWDSNADGKLDEYARAAGFEAPVRVRLHRSADTFTAACRSEGEAWTTVGTATLPEAADTQDVGMFMTAANGGSGARGLATFRDFTRVPRR